MKPYILSAALLLCVSAATAQEDNVEYGNNSFSVEQQSKQLTKNPTGKIFYDRIRAFDSFSRASLKNYVSREQFYNFMGKMDELPKTAKMYGYGEYVDDIITFNNNVRYVSRLSSKDAFRNKLYEIATPVYKVVDENWGTDMVEVVIREAYLRLYEYINLKSNSEPEFYGAMKYINMDPVKTNEALGQCQFTVNIDKKLQKEDIEVYFSDLALFKKISRKYSGNLLEGPIRGWQAMKDESDVVKSLLRSYEGKKDIPAYYSYMYILKDYGNPATVQQNLYKDNKWFVWVFRNGTLYYSYIALPCSEQNMVTVYEERPVAGLEAVPDAVQFE